MNFPPRRSFLERPPIKGVTVGIFTGRHRPSSTADPEAREELPPAVRMGLPPRFEAVGEALASGSNPLDACQVVGRALARDGASLEETLSALRQTWQSVRGTDPSYDAVTALSVAWSESTLAYMHQLSCEDPMTGLASLAHVRSRLSELFRGQLREAATLNERIALVILDLPHDRHGMTNGRGDQLTRALRITRLGEAARTVFPRGEVIGRLGPNRIVVIAERDSRLGARVRLLRRIVEGIQLDGYAARVWIEGVPASDDGAASLLDELARP